MACNGDSQTIPDQAKRIMKDVFQQQSKAAPLPGQWSTLTPKDMESLDCAPSKSSSYYLREDGSEDEVQTYLDTNFDNVFSDVGLVETFWEDFSMNLSHKLGLPYRETQKMDSPTYSEAKLRHHILHPILKEVSNAACIHPKFKGKTIRMNYFIEDELKMMSGKSGQNPSVDAVIQVSDADGKTLALVPVEMKVNIAVEDYSQIACYINKLSSVEDIRDYVIVGIIIDKKQFRFAFSVFRSQSIPLPIVHMSPPIAWKMDSLIQEPSMLVLACSFLIGQLKRLEYPASMSGKKTSSLRVSLSTLKQMGEELCKHPILMFKPEQERFGLQPLKRKIDQQQDEIDQQQVEIKKMKKTIEGLEAAIKRSGESQTK